MNLGDILRNMHFSGESATVDIPKDWLQGRSAYGGLQAAIALRAMRQQVAAEIPLRSLQTVFIAPAPAGPKRVETRVLREGKSAIQVEAKMFDGDQIVLLVIGVFGRSRDSKITINVPPPTAPRSATESQTFPYIPGIMPEFTQYIEFRWATANVPFSGAAEPRLQAYMRFCDPPPADEVGADIHLVALADAPPSPGMVSFRGPVAGSSLTWTLELLDEQPTLAPDDYIYIDNEGTAARHGYINQTATLWRGDGKALALSRQTFVIFG
jgi:acyl-CoA thioesterase